MAWHKSAGAASISVRVPKPVMPSKKVSTKAPGVNKVVGSKQITPDIAKAGRIKKASKK